MADACTVVIFGGSGDLTRRKLLPALYYLAEHKLLHENFALLGVAREPSSDDAYRKVMREEMSKSDEIHRVNDEVWQWLAERMFYTHGDFTKDAAYETIGKRLNEIEAGRPEDQRNRLFYLAIPPSVFEPTLQHLCKSGLARRTLSYEERPWYRVVIEKPFGRSLESARALNRLVLDQFGEHQIYRIDHYLGKESVQNILVFRFANSIFEPLWNRNYISHVQIIVAEAVGVEGRGKYYEEAGILRDMFQNHLLQLLTLAAMEPPSAFTGDAVRDEKVKVLRSIRPLVGDGEPPVVLGQYTEGTDDGKPVTGYREEPNVSPMSVTPTYAAMRVSIDNWRWKGVPFYLRSGKRLGRRISEISVQFRSPPLETLLLDCMTGDPTLFTRSDEVEMAWSIIDPILEYWNEHPLDRVPTYPAGSAGPVEAIKLLDGDHTRWR